MATTHDDANLVYITSDVVKQSYIRGAFSNAKDHAIQGIKPRNAWPEGTLLGDAERKGYAEGLRLRNQK